MFIASKLLSFATQPLAWVLVLLLIGLLLMPRWHKRGVGLLWLALTVLTLQGWEPLPDALLRQLETRYKAPPINASLSPFVGVMLLGGALEPAYVWEGHGQPALNDAAERMTAAVELIQRTPHLRLLFTGGEGEMFAGKLTEADRAKIFFDRMGVDPLRVTYESASHTTYENAVLSASVPGMNTSQPWLLLTSASHMPRAMATFVKAGWNVTAYPVDYRTGLHTPWTQYSLATGASKWHLLLHEWIGLLSYQLAGRA